MMDSMIAVQHEDFDVGRMQAQLRGQNRQIGAIVSFTGLVREFGDAEDIQALTLEHYPGMTEKALQDIADQAQARWSLQAVVLIHRVGTLQVGEQIVLVMTAAAHRWQAFEAAQYMMDFLKTDAPFWKKEHTASGAHWVEQKQTDVAAKKRWLHDA